MVFVASGVYLDVLTIKVGNIRVDFVYGDFIWRSSYEKWKRETFRIKKNVDRFFGQM
jgi:hypothetical protein